MLTLLTLCASIALSPDEPPIVEVTKDNTEITTSCRVSIPVGTIIADADGNGVIQIAADGVTVEFTEGSALRGAPPETPGDELKGTGIRIQGRKGVTLLHARVHGFRNGVHATDADGLTVDTADLCANYRQHLRSTPSNLDDGADWLSPHHNDKNEWLERYGAALYVEDSDGVVIRAVRVREGQNGILLDRVNDSKVYDNDASFLSGWGLGLWRSNRNVISRNAFDFCVRGHEEGKYNRGQDSAGILMFEQNSDNVLAENSVTHGGDGIFGFAGREALGETWVEAERERLRKEGGGRDDKDIDARIGRAPGYPDKYKRLGNTDNLFIDNDLSYAPAHGLEMTFSEGNQIVRNRFVGNAICGIWGGYSSDTLIADNVFEDNGGMAYGMERGGVNIEHGSDNLIVDNLFKNNRAAVHLWWDNDGSLLRNPGVAAGYKGVTGNVVAENRIVIDADHPFKPGRRGGEVKLVGLQLRDAVAPGETSSHVRDNVYANNTVTISAPGAVELDLGKGITTVESRPDLEPKLAGERPWYTLPSYEILGHTKPVGARRNLAGRENIVMTEWGPWDHEAPLVRLYEKGAAGVVYQVFGVQGDLGATVESGQAKAQLEPAPSGSASAPAVVRVTSDKEGVQPYRIRLRGGDGFDRALSGTVVSTKWDARFWAWNADPLVDLAGWRAEADGAKVLRATVPAISFNYAFGGPKDQKISDEISKSDLTGDRFGMIATTSIPLTKGKWRLRTVSDDGIRVFKDGQLILEHWDIHPPAPDTAEFTLDADRPVEFKVEHFENSGFSTLSIELEPAD